MQKITIISLVALVLVSAWLGSAPANKLDVSDDKLGFTIDDTSPSLPADPQEPQAAAAELTVSPADGVLQAVEELAARMEAEFSAMRRERDDMQGSVDRLALLIPSKEDEAEEPVKEEPKAESPKAEVKAEEPDGQWVTEPVYEQVCRGNYCEVVQTGTRRVWMPRTKAGQAVKTVLGAICPCGCPGCDPELCTCLQTNSAPLREPAVSYSIPVRQVSYSPVMTTYQRARTPVFTRRCGPVRRLLGWCR